jgi:NADH-quinone oxidoreductase subunit I
MGAAAQYFRHIKEAVTTVFDGMAVTASHMIRKPYTVQYPDRVPVRVQDTLPFRYRGILDVDLEICTGCLACDRACPIDCIAIAIEKNAQTREIVISQFDIDIAKCMYCGLCSEPCPTGAIHHTTEFEGADYSLESLIRRFIAEPIVAYKPKKGPEPDVAVANLLERGMKYVDEWAQPGSDKPAATAGAAKPAPAPAKPTPTPAKPVAVPKAPASSAAPAPAIPKPAPATDRQNNAQVTEGATTSAAANVEQSSSKAPAEAAESNAGPASERASGPDAAPPATNSDATAIKKPDDSSGNGQSSS